MTEQKPIAALGVIGLIVLLFLMIGQNMFFSLLIA
jgi:hypothetical protein